VEIHIDADKNWFPEMNDKTPENQINVFNVLLHEIEHALGLSHSNNAKSIMYAFYDDKKLELQADDILAIQSLYGSP
jgi:predicted Zn-dependent protease